jgi:hypothetical protein
VTGVVRTTGGKWNPGSENLMFLAGPMMDQKLAENPYTLVAVNELTGKSLDLLDRWMDERTILLDSGVFALASAHARAHNITMTQAFSLPPEEMDGWDELYMWYCLVVSRFADRMWGAIELDQGGPDAAAATRARVKRDTGVDPIPVYHPLGDGWAYYDQLARAHDRICVGGLAGKIPASVRMRLCWTVTDRARAHPHLWTHLRGVTPSPMVMSLGLRGSMDSSAWLGPVRWTQQWKSWAMLQRIGEMPTAMTYVRGSRDDPNRGLAKAKLQAAADAYFQQRTFAAIVDDTHPPVREVTHP